MTEQNRSTVVGFIGLGNMGRPMALRLVRAGYEVRAYDLVQEAREALRAAGAVAAESAAHAATGAKVVILMLPNSSVVRDVVTDAEFMQALDADALVVDMSSGEPAVTRELAAHLADRGIRMIDAPVSGGVSGAKNGTLTIMAAGTAEEVEVARPLLEVLGKVFAVGPVGSGHALKAFNNLLSATHLWATGEVMAAGERFGLDPDVMLSVFNASSGRSGSTEAKWPRFVRSGSFDSGFSLQLMIKDMRIAMDLCAKEGVPARLGQRALEVWEQAGAELDPGADHTEIARWLAKDHASASPERDQPGPKEPSARSMTTTNDAPTRTDAIRQAFEADGIAWDDGWEAVCRLDPEFAEAFRRMRAVPWTGTALSPAFKALVELAVNAAATHLNVAEILPSLRRALDLGAEPRAILEVLELSATVGIHAMNIGVPLLVEVLEERGRTGPEPLNAEQLQLKERFIRERGYWHEFWDNMLELDPEMFRAYVDFSTVPWRTGVLTPAEKELIYISYDIAATHLYVPGTKLHIRNALNHGATTAQILEVMEIASLLGVQGVTATMPLLVQELRDRGRWPKDKSR
jgi:3-hydroxyisobutyrate dehydrogenase